jgi:hypothetical protein
VRRRSLPCVETRKGGPGLLLRRIPPVMALALRELPSLLADDAPGIRNRLSGNPYPEDGDAARQWREYAVPELEHLFRTSRDLVGRDLAGLEPEPRLRNRFRMEIPAEHLTAWLSALAAVRVALGEAHGLTEEELETLLPPVLTCEKDRAILLVHLLGWVQGLLVEGPAEPAPRRPRKPRRPASGNGTTSRRTRRPPPPAPA